MAIGDTIKTIIAGQISKQKSDIDENVTLESLGMDSLDRVEVVMKIEEELGVELSDEKVDTITTTRELIEYVESLKK
jgi:acyl carrier protein